MSSSFSLKLFFLKIGAIWQMLKRGISMRMSLDSANGTHLATIDTASKIPELLEFGKNYRPDPGKKGRIDLSIHPRFVQHKINTKNYGTHNMDCDDHAVYWCAMLLKNKLADKVWFVTIAWKASGHAFCVYEKNGEYFWGDYKYPAKCIGKLGFLAKVNEAYKETNFKHSIMFDVEYNQKKESIKLRSPKVIMSKK